MRVISDSMLAAVLGRLEGEPRVVMSGNFGTPWQAVKVLDASVPRYRLFALNAQVGTPDRDGVTLESPFVGPGMRHSERLRYLPCRCRLCPICWPSTVPPDVVMVHTSSPVRGTVSLGTEVNILPAAIEAVRARGGLVVAQLNRHMPYSYGDAVLSQDDIDLAIEADTLAAVPASAGARRRCSGPSASGSRSSFRRRRPCSWASARSPMPSFPRCAAAGA